MASPAEEILEAFEFTEAARESFRRGWQAGCTALNVAQPPPVVLMELASTVEILADSGVHRSDGHPLGSGSWPGRNVDAADEPS